MLRTLPTNSKVFFAHFTEYAGKSDLDKKIGGNHAFFEDNHQNL